MKRILLIMLVAVISSVQAQEKKKEVLTATIKVLGNCDQCKNRIENAADIKGVKTSTWNEETQTLTVVYRADKVSEQQIKEAVLRAGHDVEDKKAPDNVYKKLPECCKFRDKKCEEKK